LNFKFRSMAKAAPFFLGAMCLFIAAGCGSSSSKTASTAVSNTVPVMANFGPPGAGGDVDVLFVSVTVCQHGTSNCTTIDNVKVDTGSFGLRVVSAAVSGVTLTQINESNTALEECVQYADTSYSWGPVQLADVQIGSEKAFNIPIQVIGATNNLPVPQKCLTTPVATGVPNGGNEDSLGSLGANGILGIGGEVFDCGSTCANSASNMYYICPSGTCQEVAAPTSNQAVNPIAEFTSSDNNGVVITLPAVPATGSVSVSGTMTFGIGTQSDNALTGVTLFAMDACGNFPSASFNGITYMDNVCQTGSGGFGAFLDTGSNGLFLLDANTLHSVDAAISDCANANESGFYCLTAGGTATLSPISLLGDGNVGSGTVSVNITDANKLFSTNNAEFNDLGGDSVVNGSATTDFFDFGLPFFLGKKVFVGIAGQAAPAGVNAPNGFVAF
jgi:hypothetical protein